MLQKDVIIEQVATLEISQDNWFSRITCWNLVILNLFIYILLVYILICIIIYDDPI